jgi:hypothetical protein
MEQQLRNERDPNTPGLELERVAGRLTCQVCGRAVIHVPTRFTYRHSAKDVDHAPRVTLLHERRYGLDPADDIDELESRALWGDR